MEITGEYQIKGPRDDVWRVLNDPDHLVKAIPGAERLDVVGEDRYSAEMSVGVGMIRGRFTGTVEVHDKIVPESYRMVIDGKGSAGWIRGEGVLTLTQVSEDSTLITVKGDASVGGLLARVGQRLVRNVANTLMNQFFKDIEKQVSAGVTKHR